MSRRALALVAAAGVALLPVLLPHPFVLTIATQAAIWALLAASWDLLSGYTGQISFGHAGFFALGAYAAAAATKHAGVSPWLGLLVGATVAAAVGLLAGFPALRLRGHYLALVTLGLAEITRLVAQNWLALTGGPFGIHDFRSFPGLPGIGTTRYKLLAFTLSSGFAGLAGALYAYYVQLVSPSVASAATTSLIIGMAVFGGLGTLWGPVLGALLLYGLYEGLRFVGVVYNLIAVGLVIMVFVIYLPRGLAGFRRSA